MKKPIPRKLHVNAEAIRNLSHHQLGGAIVGGATTVWGTCAHCECGTSTSCPKTK